MDSQALQFAKFQRKEAIILLYVVTRFSATNSLVIAERLRRCSAYLDELRRKSPEIASAATLAREFCRIIKERDTAAWPKWCEDTKTGLLATFAKYLCRDEAAVLAALQQPWSNGPVEGNIHRLKLIKRSMYGRAKFDLLRIRVVHAA